MRQLRITFYWLLRTLAALDGVSCFLLAAASLQSGNYRAFCLCWLCSGLFNGLFVEEWIIRCSPRNWRWFSWGGKVGAIRPIRIISSDSWFEELKPIIKLAHVVIVIPGPSDSISKEFDFLLDARMHHTVILLPPRRQNDRF